MKYAFIGDIHSQVAPLELALQHCAENNLTPIFLGDLFDSREAQSYSVEVYRLVRHWQEHRGAIVLRSNHQDKFERWAKGNGVQVKGEFARTVEDFAQEGIDPGEVLAWLDSMPYGVVFRDSRDTEYRVAHACFPSWLEIPEYEGVYQVNQVSKKERKFMLFGPQVAGAVWPEQETRVLWWLKESNRSWVRVAGHYHEVHVSDRSLVLDGGCGGSSRDWPTSAQRAHSCLCLWDVEAALLTQFACS
jgi:hypothetical protein